MSVGAVLQETYEDRYRWDDELGRWVNNLPDQAELEFELELELDNRASVVLDLTAEPVTTPVPGRPPFGIEPAVAPVVTPVVRPAVTVAPSRPTRPGGMRLGEILPGKARLAIAGLVLAAGAGLGAFVAATGRVPHVAATLPLWDRPRFSANTREVWAGFKETMLNPAYFGFLVILVICERLWPAEKDLKGRRWLVGMASDLVWFAMQTLAGLTVVAFALVGFSAFLDQATGGAHLDAVPVLGTVGAAVLAMVVGDLMGYWSHFIHHKIATLWQFHQVHHAQTEMNVLSDHREHFMETIINNVWVLIPAQLLGLDLETVAILVFVNTAVAALIHANIRTDLGPLRWLINSPQAHRVHHADTSEFYNSNFSVTFAFWDYLFGTRYADRSAYPTTGVDDYDHPLQRSLNPFSLMATWAAETVYPFKVIGERAKLSFQGPATRLDA